MVRPNSVTNNLTRITKPLQAWQINWNIHGVHIPLANPVNNLAIPRRVLDRALVICLVVGVPVAVTMATLGDWAIRILFVRGAFDLAAAEASGAILAAYALGLVPALALRSLVAGFHGRGDTRTPLRLLVAATLVNIALKIVLAPMLGAVGLALPSASE